MNDNTIQSTTGLERPNRFTYLLHLWLTNGQWRISLQSLETGKRLGFPNPEQLFAYLMDLIEGNMNKQSHPSQEQKDEAEKAN